MVSLGQIFVFIQLGLPGAFNVIGLGVLKLANKQQILLLLAKRSSPLFLFALLTNFLFDLNVWLTILVFLGYLTLIPNQWITNAFQGYVSNIEFAMWRIMPTGLQLAFIICLESIEPSWTLRLFLEIWSLSIAMTFILVCLRYKRVTPQQASIVSSISLNEVESIGRSGFIAHIGLSDILRVENYLIPFLKPVNYSANYFVIGGLANWPRVLIDGLSTGYFPSYKSLDFEKARNLALKRVIGTISLASIAIFVVRPYGDGLLQACLGFRYGHVFDLFIAFSLTVLFSSARRMYLDSFRSQGESKSRMASRFEIQSWLISATSLPIVFTNASLGTWANVSAMTSLLSLIYLIKRGQSVAND